MKKNILSSMIALSIAVSSGGSIAAVEIDPYPPVVGGSKVPAPNIFVVIDNSKSAVIQTGPHDTPNVDDVNTLKQIASGLREAFKPLIGKVRVGFTTTKRIFTSANDNYTCAQMKLDGHPGQPPSMYGEYGSGWGQLVPHILDKEYYKQFSGWLGSLCAAVNNTKDRKADNLNYSNSYYRSIRGDYPYFDYINDQVGLYHENGEANNRQFNPILDVLIYVGSIISDKEGMGNFIRGGTAISTRLKRENYHEVYDKRRITKDGKSHRPYDAYAPIDPEDGYPKDSGALSCRQNYAIIISSSASTGDKWFAKNSTRTLDKLKLPDNTYYNPNDSGYGYIYKTALTNDKVEDIKSSYSEKSHINDLITQRISNFVFAAYYNDLKSGDDFPNDVPAYMPQKQPRKGLFVNGKYQEIPEYWDRKNDPATWQHLTTFVIGYTQGMPAWQKAQEAYSNMPNVDYSKDGALEGYFRAIETGDIYKHNQSGEYFWEYGGLSLPEVYLGNKAKSLSNKEGYKGAIEASSYIFPLNTSNVNCSQIDPLGSSSYTSYKKACKVFIGNPLLKKYYNKYDFSEIADSYKLTDDFFIQMDLLRAGMLGRGGSYAVDNKESLEKALNNIVLRIQSALLQGNTAGAASSGTITSQQATPVGIFTTFTDQETRSGNIFSYQFCTAQQRKDPNIKNKCDTLRWNAAEQTYDKFPPLFLAKADHSLVSFVQKELKNGTCKKCNEMPTVTLPIAQYLTGVDTNSGGPAVSLTGYPARPKIKVYQGETKTENGITKPAGLKDINKDNLMAEMTYSSPLTVTNGSELKLTNPIFSEQNRGYRGYLVDKAKHQPLVVSSANDGKVYGFDASGVPIFQFMPADIVKTLSESGVKSPNYIANKMTVQDVYLPASGDVPTSKDDWHTMLVGTIRSTETGKDTLFALDLREYFKNGQLSTSSKNWSVELPGNITTTPRIIWVADDSDLGKENSVDTDGKWVVLVPSGYNAASDDGGVSLMVYDIKDGKLLGRADTHAVYKLEGKTCVLSESTKDLAEKAGLQKFAVNKFNDCENGLGALTVYDENGDYGADVVFAGDLLGHVWKFRLDYSNSSGSSSEANTDKASAGTESKDGVKVKVDYDGHPLFIATNTTGQRQSITVKIDIANGEYGEGEMLYFGTGRFFNQGDKNVTNGDSFYGIWDNPRHFDLNKPQALPLTRDNLNVNKLKPLPKNAQMTDGDGKVVDEFTDFRVIDPKDGTVLGCRDFASYNKNERGTITNITTITKEGDSTSTECAAHGWVIDFPESSAAERVIDLAVNFEGNVFFMSYEPNSGTTEKCTFEQSGGTTRLYTVDRMTGLTPDEPAFDYNGDGVRKLGGTAKKGDKDVPVSGDGVLHGGKAVSFAGTTLKRGGAIGGMISLLERGKLGDSGAATTCDYKRTMVFPSATDASGKPLQVTGCYQNRFKLWKQPVIE